MAGAQHLAGVVKAEGKLLVGELGCAVCSHSTEESEAEKEPSPLGLEYVWTKAMILSLLSGPRDSVRVADLGSLCQAAFLHPTLWGRCRRTGCSQPAYSLGAAESSGFAINVVSK